MKDIVLCKIKKGVLYMKKDVVLNEVKNELNLKERIIVTVFTKTFKKVYKLGIAFGFNNK